MNQTHYRKFLISLLSLFRDAKPFLDNRGAFIIRQLCTLLNSELIFRVFAEIIIEDNSNLKFSSTMVRTLNTILLTSSELFELRSLLRNIDNEVRWIFCLCTTKSLNYAIRFAEIGIIVSVPLQILVALSRVDVVALPARPMLWTCIGNCYIVVCEIGSFLPQIRLFLFLI